MCVYIYIYIYIYTYIKMAYDSWKQALQIGVRKLLPQN